MYNVLEKMMFWWEWENARCLENGGFQVIHDQGEGSKVCSDALLLTLHYSLPVNTTLGDSEAAKAKRASVSQNVMPRRA